MFQQAAGERSQVKRPNCRHKCGEINILCGLPFQIICVLPGRNTSALTAQLLTLPGRSSETFKTFCAALSEYVQLMYKTIIRHASESQSHFKWLLGEILHYP